MSANSVLKGVGAIDAEIAQHTGEIYTGGDFGQIRYPNRTGNNGSIIPVSFQMLS